MVRRRPAEPALREHSYALPRLHAIFQKHRVRPTYLITWPVAKDARSAAVLRDLLSGRDCEIGAHHHACETPPCTHDDVRRHQYALQLPAAQFAAQVVSLTTAIGSDAVGERSLAYRSGRFGFSAAHVSDLERAGYTVESSIAPLFYEGHKGGPDFVGAPPAPYFLAYDDPTGKKARVCVGNADLKPVRKSGSDCDLLEIRGLPDNCGITPIPGPRFLIILVRFRTPAPA